MDYIGKQVLKGTVDKHMQKISGETSSESYDDPGDNLSNEQRRQLQEQIREKKEKLTKEQDQKRAARAKSREEMRQKYSLKPSENDQQILKESEALPWVDTDETDGIMTEVSAKMKSAWDSITNVFK